MASSSFNLQDLSPKSMLMMKYMKKLEAKIEKLEGGLESMTLDFHNHGAKSKKKKRRSKKNNVTSSYDDNESCNNRSHRREKLVKRHQQIVNEPKKNSWDLIKGKILPFTSNDSVDDYYD
ncbi:hypothetical protein CR513_33996, partial [Mucuna pruriens]